MFALDIETAEDAYERTRSPLHWRLVNDLLNGFLAQNNGNWADNTWNDDMGWMSLALVQGYQITGNKTFLDKAIYAWNIAYNRGWDTKYGGGGVWENMDNFVHGDGRADKLALSNEPFVNCRRDAVSNHRRRRLLDQSQSDVCLGPRQRFQQDDRSGQRGREVAHRQAGCWSVGKLRQCL